MHGRGRKGTNAVAKQSTQVCSPFFLKTSNEYKSDKIKSDKIKSDKIKSDKMGFSNVVVLNIHKRSIGIKGYPYC